VAGLHRRQCPWGPDEPEMGRQVGSPHSGEVELDSLSMWQCGHHSSCSNGGVRSGNRLGLAYRFRPEVRWDSDICEPSEYDKADKWGTSGRWWGMSDERVRISSSFYTGRFGRRRRQVQPCVSERGRRLLM